MLFFLNSAFDTSVQMQLTENVLVYVRTWVTLGGLPHLSCKCDQIKMRDYMERRVTSPTKGCPTCTYWTGPKLHNFGYCKSSYIYFFLQPLYGLYTENVINFESVFQKKTKKAAGKRKDFSFNCQRTMTSITTVLLTG